MSRRTRRTKVYDCNYNIGERYYKPTLDSLDRKYSGRPESSSSMFDESPSSRASKFFEDQDSNKLNGTTNRTSLLHDDEDDFDEEVNSTLKRIKAARAQRSTLEDDLDSFSSRKNELKKRINVSEKLLDSVGINGKTQQALEDDIFFKKRTLRSNEEDDDKFSKWTQIKPASKVLQEAADNVDELAAIARARKSRARLADIDAEMEELAERGAAREKRLAGLKALVADSEDATQIKVSKRISVKASTEKKQVSF